MDHAVSVLMDVFPNTRDLAGCRCPPYLPGSVLIKHLVLPFSVTKDGCGAHVSRAGRHHDKTVRAPTRHFYAAGDVVLKLNLDEKQAHEAVTMKERPFIQERFPSFVGKAYHLE